MESTDGDLFDLYFSLVENSSESPLIYHRWTLISAVGALLGRQTYIDFAFDTIYPNMYVCLMGSAGSRKSSAIKVARTLLEGAGYNTFAREKTSNQKFLKDLGEGFDNTRRRKSGKKSLEDYKDDLSTLTINADDDDDFEDDYDPNKTSEVYISAGELEDFLGQNDGQFISLLTNLWDNLKEYSHGKMTSDDVFIPNPTISMIGGATPTTFNNVFPPEVIGQGMLSRLLLIYGGGARKKITLPPAPDSELVSFFVKHLLTIKKTIEGKMTLTPEAFKVWDAVYQSELELGDSRLESYGNRRHVHYYKLCIVLAALELSNVITEEIAIKANTIMSFAESLMPKALGEFGKSRNSDVAQLILEEIDRAEKTKGTGLESIELFARVSKQVENMAEFSTIIRKLLESKRIQVGSDRTIILAREAARNTLPYVDYNLLREFRDLPPKQQEALWPLNQR